MKIVLDLELNREPKDDDIIIFKEGKWKVVPLKSLYNPIISAQRQINVNLKEEIRGLKEAYTKLARIVKEK